MDYITESNILDTIDTIDTNSLYAEMDLLNAMVQYEHKIETFNELSESDYVMEGSFEYSKLGILLQKVGRFISRMAQFIINKIKNLLSMFNSDNQKNFLATLGSQQVQLAVEYGFILTPVQRGGVQFSFRMIDLDMVYNLLLDVVGFTARIVKSDINNRGKMQSDSYYDKLDREIEKYMNNISIKLNPDAIEKIPNIQTLEDVKKWDEAAKASGKMFKLYTQDVFDKKITDMNQLMVKLYNYSRELGAKDPEAYKTTIENGKAEIKNNPNNPTVSKAFGVVNKLNQAENIILKIVNKMITNVQTALKLLVQAMNPKDPNSLYSQKYRAKAEDSEYAAFNVANDESIYNAAVNSINNQNAIHNRASVINKASVYPTKPTNPTG